MTVYCFPSDILHLTLNRSKRNLDEQFVSAQKRPDEVLVMIQMNGWIQICVLTLINFVRQGVDIFLISQGMMHDGS